MRLLGKKGTALTTNPSVFDVRTGVPFQGTDYPNGTIGQNDNNAKITSTVINPPSAYALGIERFFNSDFPYYLQLNDIGATSLQTSEIIAWMERSYAFSGGGSSSTPSLVSVASNALPRSVLVEIMTACLYASPGNYTLDVSGGYNDALASVAILTLDLAHASPGGTYAEYLYIHNNYPYGQGYCFNMKTSTQTLDPSRPQGATIEDVEVPIASYNTPSQIAGILEGIAASYLSEDGQVVSSSGSVFTWQALVDSSRNVGAPIGLSADLNYAPGYDPTSILADLASKNITVYYN